jgi:uncharacterized protein YhdP
MLGRGFGPLFVAFDPFLRQCKGRQVCVLRYTLYPPIFKSCVEMQSLFVQLSVQFALLLRNFGFGFSTRESQPILFDDDQKLYSPTIAFFQ